MLFFNAHPVVVIVILEVLLCLYAVAAAVNAQSKTNRLINIVIAVVWIVFAALNLFFNVL